MARQPAAAELDSDGLDHWSDCRRHDAPALKPGACSCGVSLRYLAEEIRRLGPFIKEDAPEVVHLLYGRALLVARAALANGQGRNP